MTRAGTRFIWRRRIKHNREHNWLPAATGTGNSRNLRTEIGAAACWDAVSNGCRPNPGKSTLISRRSPVARVRRFRATLFPGGQSLYVSPKGGGESYRHPKSKAFKLPIGCFSGTARERI